jgi:hypothetical protein
LPCRWSDTFQVFVTIVEIAVQSPGSGIPSTGFREALKGEKAKRLTNVRFSISIGDAVRRAVHFHRLPARIHRLRAKLRVTAGAITAAVRGSAAGRPQWRVNRTVGGRCRRKAAG